MFCITKIYPLKQYRLLILEKMDESGKKSDYVSEGKVDIHLALDTAGH